MHVVARLAFVGVFLMLMREGVRLIASSVFLVDANSPFPKGLGALVGLAALVVAVICIALAFKLNYLSRRYVLASSGFCLLLLASALGSQSACENLAPNLHIVEMYACQRFPNVIAGSAIASVLMAALWVTGRSEKN